MAASRPSADNPARIPDTCCVCCPVSTFQMRTVWSARNIGVPFSVAAAEIAVCPSAEIPSETSAALCPRKARAIFACFRSQR